jgi:Domain of unknown function (DUF1996)
MFIGNISARSLEDAARFRQLTYVCTDTWNQRAPESIFFPNRPCSQGIVVSQRFPTCWDGVNLDSPDHMSHMSYPESGTFESGGPCPATHPVRTPQVFYEVIFDTKPFNDLPWPRDANNNTMNPFVWSFGDATGYANHADYVFGWKDDALQKIMDVNSYFNNTGSGARLPLQTIEQMNNCTKAPMVTEDIGSDGCKQQLLSSLLLCDQVTWELNILTIYLPILRDLFSPRRIPC